MEFINPNLRPIVEKETDEKAAGGERHQNGTKEEWYWLNAYSRIPVSGFFLHVSRVILVPFNGGDFEVCRCFDEARCTAFPTIKTV